MWLVLVGF